MVDGEIWGYDIGRCDGVEYGMVGFWRILLELSTIVSDGVLNLAECTCVMEKKPDFDLRQPSLPVLVSTSSALLSLQPVVATCPTLTSP